MGVCGGRSKCNLCSSVTPIPPSRMIGWERDGWATNEKPGPDADVWLPPGRLGITRTGWGPPTSRTDHSASPPSSYPGPDISHLPQFYWALGREVSFDWPPPRPAHGRKSHWPGVLIGGQLNLHGKNDRRRIRDGCIWCWQRRGGQIWNPDVGSSGGTVGYTTVLWANTVMQVRNMGID